MDNNNVPFIHSYKPSKAFQEEKIEDSSSNLKFYLLLCTVIITLQSTLICFLIVNLVNQNPKIAVDDNDVVTPQASTIFPGNYLSLHNAHLLY